jgi:hypothetical protein
MKLAEVLINNLRPGSRAYGLCSGIPLSETQRGLEESRIRRILSSRQDSKQLKEEERDNLFEVIERESDWIGWGVAG